MKERIITPIVLCCAFINMAIAIINSRYWHIEYLSIIGIIVSIMIIIYAGWLIKYYLNQRKIWKENVVKGEWNE